MSAVRSLLLGLLALLIAACTQPPAPRPHAQTVATLVFRDVRANAFDGVDVAVDEGRIVLIGVDLNLVSSAVAVDGTGKTPPPSCTRRSRWWRPPSSPRRAPRSRPA
jgi:hypothetical protein